MHRRAFLKTSTLSIAGVTALGFTNTQSKNLFGSSQFAVNGKRIEGRIFELAKFGVDEKGRGYRVAYTKGDIEGRAWFMDLMKKAGLNS